MLDLLGNRTATCSAKSPKVPTWPPSTTSPTPTSTSRSTSSASTAWPSTPASSPTAPRSRVLGSHFTSNWDASGQIPERGVARGHHLALRQHRPHRGRPHQPHQRLGGAHHRACPHDAVLRQQAYYSQLRFQPVFQLHLLPARPDKRRRNQPDRRPQPLWLHGHLRARRPAGRPLRCTARLGVGTRNDFTDLGLRRAVRRADRSTPSARAGCTSTTSTPTSTKP